jgi:hypothetical protein
MSTFLRYFVLLLVIFSTGTNSHAQNALSFLQSRLGAALNAPNLVYRYQVSIAEEGSNKPINIIQGTIIKNGSDFVDSNARQVRIRSGQDYLQLDMHGHKAWFGNIAALAKKHRLNPELTAALRVPDSVLLKHAVVRVDSISDRSSFIVEVDLRNADILLQTAVLWINKSNLGLVRLRYDFIHTDDAFWQESKQYRYRFEIYDIATRNNALPLTLDSYISIKRQKAELVGTYATFKLIPIL